MNIFIENEISEDLKIDYEKIAKDVILACLSYEKCPYDAEISLLITNSEEIKKLNLDYRNIDSDTDVLSFPLVDFDAPSNFDYVEGELVYFNPETDELMLGDIVICWDRVLSQAEAYGHNVIREYAFLIAHSMLHLLGYDHMSDDEREIMEDKQRNILETLGINR